MKTAIRGPPLGDGETPRWRLQSGACNSELAPDGALCRGGGQTKTPAMG